MKNINILMIHNSYIYRGGEDESCRLEYEELVKKGYQVDILLIESKNHSNSNKFILWFDLLLGLKTFFYLKKMLSKKVYKIVHIQNNFPLIPSYFYFYLWVKKIKAIQAVRNYRLICPAGTAFRNGSFCTNCSNTYFPIGVVKYKCYKSRYFPSFASFLIFIANKIIGSGSKYTTGYLAVSQFVKNKMTESGFDEKKIMVKPNFVPKKLFYDLNRSGALYVGRLSKEKGIGKLLEYWNLLGTHKVLTIIGDGDFHEVRDVKNKVQAMDNVVYMGKLNFYQVQEQIAQAEFLIIPSLWDEPFGRVSVEAISCGVPVLASKSGGLQDVVIENITGALYEKFDFNDFKCAYNRILKYSADPNFSEKCKNHYNDFFNEAVNVEMIGRFYLNLMD